MGRQRLRGVNRLAKVPDLGAYKVVVQVRLEAGLAEWLDAEAKRLDVSRSSIHGYALRLVQEWEAVEPGRLRARIVETVRRYRKKRD